MANSSRFSLLFQVTYFRLFVATSYWRSSIEMDFNLTEQELMIRTRAREFARKSVEPRAAEIDRTNEWPSDLVAEMAKSGLFGLQLPPEYHGSGAGYKCYALAIEQISQSSMTVAAIIAINALSEEAIYRYGSEEQKQTFLTPLARGEHTAMFAFTEAATGIDPKLITTRASPEDNCYILKGEKTFASLAPGARVAVIFAKDETENVSAFIVDPSSKGFVIAKCWEMMGLRGSGTCQLSLQDIAVPQKNLLGEKGKGYDILLLSINVGQLGICAEAVGTAQAALEMSLDYARNRPVRGKSMLQLPIIQSYIGEMASRIEAARWLTYKVAAMKDEGRNIRKDVAMAKLIASQTAVDVTGMAMQIHGSYGYTKDFPIERLYRDAKVTQIYEVVSEIQRIIVAASLMS
ncbi:MAG: acyl-CoA dehydrogenase [Chloroflexi bacterium CG_4_9_14_3_um_filter_45_9]|nr:MAG: acyl-CoA dehydrogenase [Chloroflexi bacterium CG_4_9_14_3_um_filter_45_9]